MLWHTARKTPTQLTIFEAAIIWGAAIVGCKLPSRGAGGATADHVLGRWEQLKRLKSFAIGLVQGSEAEVAGTEKESSASKGHVAPSEQVRDEEDAFDETSSMIDMTGLSGIEEWK